jgi:hypothetical protein
MNCEKCGSENLPEATYCEACGTPFNSETVSHQDPLVFVPVDAPRNNPSPESDLNGDTDSGVTEPSETGEEKSPELSSSNGSKQSFWKTAIIIAIIVAVIGGLGFVFRNRIIKQLSPEKYLQMSIAKSFSTSNIDDVIDWSKYEDKAVEHSFTIDAEELEIDGSMQYDPNGEQALLEMMFDIASPEMIDGPTAEEMIIYISPELIALSSPSVFSEEAFVTMNPKTFADEMEAKGYEGSEYLKDLEEWIHIFFGQEPESEDDGEPEEDFNWDYWRNAEFLEENAEFSQEGTVEKKINGKTYRLDVMRYTLSAEAANNMMQSSIEGFWEEYLAAAEEIYGSLEPDMIDEMQAEIQEVIDNLFIKEDVVFTFYIDWDGNIRKMTIEDLEFAYKGETETIVLEFEIAFGGRSSPADNISAEITIWLDSEEVSIRYDWDESFDDGVYQAEMNLSVGQDDYDIDIEYSAEWDSRKSKGDNLEIELVLNSGEESIFFEFSGTLTDSKKSTILENATLKMSDNYKEYFSIDMEYSIEIIDPEDISIDIDETTPLLEYIENFEDQYFYPDEYIL